MTYTLSNKCAKNCCKGTILVQVIIEDVVTCFLEHSCDVYAGGKVRVSEFMIFLDLQHCGSK